MPTEMEEVWSLTADRQFEEANSRETSRQKSHLDQPGRATVGFLQGCSADCRFFFYPVFSILPSK